MHFWIQQFDLGLALELRVRVLDTDDGRQPLQRVVAGEFAIFVFQQTGFARVTVYRARNGRAQSGDMRAAVGRVDGICESQLGRCRHISVLEGDLDADCVGIAFAVRILNIALHVNNAMNLAPVAIEITHKGTQTAVKIEGRLARDRLDPLVPQRNRNLARDKSHLAKTRHQCAEAELVLLHHSKVRNKADDCAGLFALFQRPPFPHTPGGNAFFVSLPPDVAVAVNRRCHFGRQSVHRRDAYAVQAAADLVSFIVKFAARAHFRHHQL